MIAFIVRRLVQAALVMLAVAFVSFAMFNFIGDPVANIVGQDTPADQIVELRKSSASMTRCRCASAASSSMPCRESSV